MDLLNLVFLAPGDHWGLRDKHTKGFGEVGFFEMLPGRPGLGWDIESESPNHADFGARFFQNGDLLQKSV